MLDAFCIRILENPKPQEVEDEQNGEKALASFVQREVAPKVTEGLVNYV